tara:strand:- start:1681 stop:2547 length:867 start_codon:yes stop_codon:yes gene_type:complete
MGFYNYLIHTFFKQEIIYVDCFKQLIEITPNIGKEKSIGLDTEFTWKNTYYPSLNLIQISAKNKIYIIDCIEITDLKPLAPIFESKEIKKIFHSMKGDLSALRTKFNNKFANIRDTQIAEFMLSRNPNQQISYKDLVKKYFFVDLPKTETNSDWTRRPLNKNQIKYASDDVRFLQKISNDQELDLKKMNLFEKYLKNCEEERKLSLTNFSILRVERLIKKNKKISSLEKNIFLWRESEAEKLNITPNKIFKEKHLSALKSVVISKKYEECQWIIRDDSLRFNFLSSFK